MEQWLSFHCGITIHSIWAIHTFYHEGIILIMRRALGKSEGRLTLCIEYCRMLQPKQHWRRLMSKKKDCGSEPILFCVTYLICLYDLMNWHVYMHASQSMPSQRCPLFLSFTEQNSSQSFWHNNVDICTDAQCVHGNKTKHLEERCSPITSPNYTIWKICINEYRVLVRAYSLKCSGSLPAPLSGHETTIMSFFL